MGGWWARLSLPSVTRSVMEVHDHQQVTCKKVLHTLSLCLSPCIISTCEPVCTTQQAKFFMLVKAHWRTEFLLVQIVVYFKFSFKIKFWNSNFQIFLTLQATPPGTRVGLIQTFQLMLHVSFTVKAIIQGYHIYRDIWSVIINEKLPCEKESGNFVISGKDFWRF